MELYDVMRTAVTTRRFAPDGVDQSVLFRILDAARFAPSGGNRQGWRVIVVQDLDRRNRLRDLYLEPWRPYSQAARAKTSAAGQRILDRADEFAENLHRVPVHLVVCVRMATLALTDSDLDRPSIVGGASIYPLVQNILLACRNEGLGAAMTTVLCANEPKVRTLLEIDDEFSVAGLVAIGHPDTTVGSWPGTMTRRAVREFAVSEGFAGAPFGPA